MKLQLSNLKLDFLSWLGSCFNFKVCKLIYLYKIKSNDHV